MVDKELFKTVKVIDIRDNDMGIKLSPSFVLALTFGDSVVVNGETLHVKRRIFDFDNYSITLILSIF